MAGSPEQLEASWTIPDPANGVIQNYTVICNDSFVFHFDDATVSVTLTGLQPYTVYSCFVSAATNGGMGDGSQPSLARTDEEGSYSRFQLCANIPLSICRKFMVGVCGQF